MNRGEIALAVVALLASGLIIAVCRTGRAVRQTGPDAASERDLAEATAATRPARETTPGIDLALRDECELLWSMPPFERAADPTTTNAEGD